MKLGAYLREEDITFAEFAAEAGVAKSTVSRWVDGTRTPDSSAMVTIARLTSGRVLPNDFFDLESAGSSVQHAAPGAAA